MYRISTLTSSFFGAGYSPIAPGTIGALFAVIIIYGLMSFVDNMIWIIPVLSILTYLLGVWSISNLPAEWKHDDSKIVIDEAHGIFISLAFVPISGLTLFIGFVLFRFFDILKPLGIRKLDMLNNHHSVMLDDTLAGIYSNIVLQLLILWEVLQF